MKNKEPKWLTDAADDMLRGQAHSYGDEEQDELMGEIDNNAHELPDDDFEPEWLTKLGKDALKDPIEPYGDEEQNELMNEIRLE